MKKRICFFTVGFAFNRLVRMKYYEKIFPKDVEIFLFTTNKYKGKEKESYQFKWDLKRTKVHVEDYNLLKLPSKLRKFCKENNIERLFNIGYFTGCLLLFYATVFSNRDFIMNRFANIGYKPSSLKDFFVILFRFLTFIFLIYPAKRVIFVDYSEFLTYKKIVPLLFLSRGKIKYLPAPVNTDLFKPKDKSLARKKLKLPLNKNIVLFVGRVAYEKGSDLFKEVIEQNPDLFFVIVGKVIDKKYLDISAKNYIYVGPKTSKELVDYYNAADIFYNLHRVRKGGIDLTTVESLATGTPAIIPPRRGIPQTQSLYQIRFSLQNANKTLREFLNLSGKQRLILSKKAREYAEKYYSDNANKKNYINYYLN